MKTVDEEHVVQNNKKIATLLVVLAIAVLVIGVLNLAIQGYVAFGCRNTIVPITGQSVQNITHIFSTVVNKIDDISQLQRNILDQIGNNNSGAIKNLLNSFCLMCPLQFSCQEIKNKQPNSASGVYLLATPSGDTNYVYCHMGELCGTEGGWARLAYLDMSDSKQDCPTGFRLYESNEVRACGRATSSDGSCQSVQFPSNNISYSQVCGRVVGYQYTSPDAVYPGDYTRETYGSVITPQHNNISSYYVDGVSITHGSPRQHIWTLMAGLNEASFYKGDSRYNCPCSQGTEGSLQNSTLQSFIGNDYFCESGNPSTDGSFAAQLYTQDPLWDGKGCGSLEGNCCSVPGLPWFNNILNSTTTDYIELRVCGDQDTNNENVPVSFYEIYVK